MRIALATLALALALVPALAAGAALTLDENGRREAIRTGEKSVGNDAFDTEWRVDNGRGEWVSVLTPFHRLVVAARHATFNGKPLKPGDPDKILKENRERLVLLVELQGASSWPTVRSKPPSCRTSARPVGRRMAATWRIACTAFPIATSMAGPRPRSSSPTVMAAT